MRDMLINIFDDILLVHFDAITIIIFSHIVYEK